jgi:hypothetical protein
MHTNSNVPTEDEVFSMEDIEFGVKRLTNGKAKDIEGYQVEIFKKRAYPHASHTQALQFNSQ